MLMFASECYDEKRREKNDLEKITSKDKKQNKTNISCANINGYYSNIYKNYWNQPGQKAIHNKICSD